MRDIISLCLAAAFVMLGFFLILFSIASPTYGGLLPFLLGCGSVILSFRIGD